MPPNKPNEPRRIFLPAQGISSQVLSSQPSAHSNKKATHAFSEIVEQDFQEAYESYVSEDLAGTLIQSSPFRGFVLIVIIINSILVGLQTNPSIEERFASTLSTVDSIFMTIFVIEILLKFYHGFWTFWRVGWNIFDFSIVAVSLLGSGASYMASGRVLRILRVLRAFRTLRSISILQGLQVIVQTILKSLPDMANITGLLMILLFIWAVLGVSLFGQEVPEYFGSVGEAMFTCFIMLTLDGWWDITVEMRDRPGLFGMTAVYFAIFITIGAFIFVNLVVGITINNLLGEYKKIYMRHIAENRSLIVEEEPNIELREVVDVSAIPSSLWLQQKNLKYLDLDNVGPELLEKYLIVIGVLERNISEFNSSKSEFDSILSTIKEFSKNDNIQIGEDEEDEGNIEGLDEEEDESVGDFLSMVIKKDNKVAEEQRRKVISQQKQAINKRRHMIESMAEEQVRVERARAWMSGVGYNKGKR
ncbi:hypothetical protein P9112_003010 [Eukaryota sp. TZLM1-RC]